MLPGHMVRLKETKAWLGSGCWEVGCWPPCGGESPEVFAVTTTVILIKANGWHRPGPQRLFLTQRPHSHLYTAVHTQGHCACSCAYTQLPHQKGSSQLEQRPYPDLEHRRRMPPRWVSGEDPHVEGLTTAGRQLTQAGLSPYPSEQKLRRTGLLQ